MGLPPAGPSFYLNVLHPDFNFDAEEATDAVNRFDVHTKAVDSGVQGLRNVFSQIRQARVGERQPPSWRPDLMSKCRDIKGRTSSLVLFTLTYHHQTNCHITQRWRDYPGRRLIFPV